MGSCAENAGSNLNIIKSKFCQNLSAFANKLIMLLTHVLGFWYPQGARLVISMKRRCPAVVAEHYWGPSFRNQLIVNWRYVLFLQTSIIQHTKNGQQLVSAAEILLYVSI